MTRRSLFSLLLAPLVARLAPTLEPKCYRPYPRLRTNVVGPGKAPLTEEMLRDAAQRIWDASQQGGP